MNKQKSLSEDCKKNILDWCKQYNYNITKDQLIDKFHITSSQAYRIISVHIPRRTENPYVQKRKHRTEKLYTEILLITHLQENENQIRLTTKNVKGIIKKYWISKISALKIYGIPIIGQSISINKVMNDIIISYELYQLVNGKSYSYEELKQKKKIIEKIKKETIQKVFNCHSSSVNEITKILEDQLSDIIQ